MWVSILVKVENGRKQCLIVFCISVKYFIDNYSYSVSGQDKKKCEA